MVLPVRCKNVSLGMNCKQNLSKNLKFLQNNDGFDEISIC